MKKQKKKSIFLRMDEWWNKGVVEHCNKFKERLKKFWYEITLPKNIFLFLSAISMLVVGILFLNNLRWSAFWILVPIVFYLLSKISESESFHWSKLIFWKRTEKTTADKTSQNVS